MNSPSTSKSPHTKDIVYCIASYQSPTQIKRLIDILRETGATGPVIVSHDQQRSRLTEHDVAGRAHVMPPRARPVEWGSFDFMDSQLDAVRAARTQFDAEWIVMLSAQDYPLAPVRQFEGYVRSSGCDALLEDFSGRPQHPSQLLRYRRQGREVPQALAGVVLNRFVRGAINHSGFMHVQDRSRGLPPLLEINRRPPLRSGEKIQTGNNWWVLGARAADVLLRRVDDDPKLVRHFKRTFIATEALVHTIVMSHPELVVDADFHLHETRWTGWSPALLTEDDIELLERSDRFFARKFEESSPILDRLDRRLRAD